MIKKDFLFFLISSLGFGLSAQILESRPEFTNAEQVAKVFNPSWYDEDAREKVKLDFLYKNRLGNFSEIRSFYTSLNLKVAKKSHLFFEGLSDQLGPYFQKNRLYAGFQLPIVINHNWTSSLGVSAGLVNYHLVASTAGIGGSKFIPDLNVGLSVAYKKHLYLGFTSAQVFNLKVQPIDYAFHIKRFYEFQAMYIKNLNVDWGGRILVRVRHDLGHFVYGRLQYKDVLVLGANYNSNKIVSLSAGFEIKSVENMKILLAFSYSTSLINSPVNREEFEIYGSYNSINP